MLRKVAGAGTETRVYVRVCKLSFHIISAHTAGPDERVEVPNEQVLLRYRIGADFCIREDQLLRLVLDCDIVNRIPGVTPLAFPTPDRTWTHDGILVYTAQDGESAADALFMSDFFSEGNNVIFMLGVIAPTDVFIATNEGGLVFTSPSPSDNITVTSELAEIIIEFEEEFGIPFDFRRFFFEQILGTWTCTANNSLGGESVQSVITDCGKTVCVYIDAY